MRDQRNIHVSKGDALLHLQTGLEYEVITADDESGKVELLMRAQCVRPPNSSKTTEIPLQGFIKIPRLNEEAANESRANEVVDRVSSTFGKKLTELKRSVGL